MRDQKVVMLDMSLVEVREPTPYKLRKKPKKLVWLARLAWWTLHKLDALQAYEKTYTVWEYTEATAAPIRNAMSKALDGIWLQNRDPSDFVFIMGAEDFHEHMNSPDFGRDVMLYTGPFHRSDYNGRRIFDIPIHVISHLKGFAIVPKVIIEKHVK